MPKQRLDNLSIEGAILKYRNFSGKPGQYNAKGLRNFCLVLDKELADTLANDGWNVRVSESKDPDEEPAYLLQVSVSFDNYPPKIYYITSESKTKLDEESVGMLDWVQIKSADVIVRPYEWAVSGKSGVKAYLKALYLTGEEDEFENKYINVPDSAISSLKDHAED